MKLRQVPEDFVVEELGVLAPAEAGPYRLYLLEKRGVETLWLLGRIARSSGVTRRQLGVAGVKDRHAVTRQYLTAPARTELHLPPGVDATLTALGFADRPLRYGDLRGNRFRIVVRNVLKGELPGVRAKARALATDGVPNYFDSQRFGSAVRGAFPARSMLVGDAEGAVRLYLAGTAKSDRSALKAEKARIAAGWDRLRELESAHPLLRPVLDAYRRTGKFEEAFAAVPYEIRKMMASAYQSLLWNMCAERLLALVVGRRDRVRVPYAAGTLLFYKRLGDAASALPEKVATLGPGWSPANEMEARVAREVLEREMTPLDALLSPPGSLPLQRSRRRALIIRPAAFSLAEPEVDELNDRGKGTRLKVALSFELPPGSYATVVTKRLFNR